MFTPNIVLAVTPCSNLEKSLSQTKANYLI